MSLNNGEVEVEVIQYGNQVGGRWIPNDFQEKKKRGGGGTDVLPE